MASYNRCSQCGHWFDPLSGESTTVCYLCEHHETAETVLQRQASDHRYYTVPGNDCAVCEEPLTLADKDRDTGICDSCWEHHDEMMREEGEEPIRFNAR